MFSTWVQSLAPDKNYNYFLSLKRPPLVPGGEAVAKIERHGRGSSVTQMKGLSLWWRREVDFACFKLIRVELVKGSLWGVRMKYCAKDLVLSSWTSRAVIFWVGKV
jgi:hypothetical protein